MPEVTENYIRLPNPLHKETGCKKLRYKWISQEKGINGLYCVDHKKYKTFLFVKDKWTMADARRWVREHSRRGVDMENTLHVKAVTEIKDGKMLAVASEEVEDREGEVLSIDGWDLKAFKKNPVLLWYHNLKQRTLPIGKAKNIGIKRIGRKMKLVFEPVFEDITEFGRTVKEFYLKNLLNAWSVGFKPIEKEGNKFLKQELLEISGVPVPALSSALVIERAKKDGMDMAQVKAILGGDDTESDEVDVKEKAVVPYRGHPPAPEGQSWDARAAALRIRRWAKGPNENEIAWLKYKQGFAWFSADDAENFGAYKLPHHDVGPAGMITVWRGVAAAMAVLLGGRGGVDVPEKDRRGIYDHLKKHYGQFDKEAPDFRLVENQVLKGLSQELEVYKEEVDYERFFRLVKNIRREVRKKVKAKKKIDVKTFGNKELIEVLRLTNEALGIALRKANSIKAKKRKGGEK